MKTPTRFLAGLVLLAGPAAAQRPRTPVDLVPGRSFDGIGEALATAGDRSAVVCSDTQDASLWITTSDGRGTAWTAPVRLDPSLLGIGEASFSDSMAIVGDDVYVGYVDRRFTTREAFLVVYDAATGTA